MDEVINQNAHRSRCVLAQWASSCSRSAKVRPPGHFLHVNVKLGEPTEEALLAELLLLAAGEWTVEARECADGMMVVADGNSNGVMAERN